MMQFDNFAPDLPEIREAVIAGRFATQRGPDGAEYTGISQYPVPLWFDLISKKIGAQIKPTISCFRLNLAGEMPHSWVHSDDICAKYASVLYCNLPSQCKGGTAFWKHVERGIDRLPTREELGEKADEFYATMTREWKEVKRWKAINFVPMKFNRFITYPTCLFHSRYPFEGFGTSPQDGRLIWICFYDVVTA
jgi:Family of unknown function (DUF6445)